MTDNHPITPPAKLILKWTSSLNGYAQAARWGADQELEACCEWVNADLAYDVADRLRAARRPKPPSLKEQALLTIDTAVADGRLSPDVSNVVRRALEQLDD
jgi:hypothetical protein